MLHRDIPEWHGTKLTWKHDAIYMAKGIWRQKRMDVCSWSATAYGPDGKSVLHADCWETITEVVKAGKIGIEERKGDMLFPIYTK